MNREQIAIEVLRCALAWERDARLVGNVTAEQIATLAASAIASCPKCGAEPWVNIDCDVCAACSTLPDAEPEMPHVCPGCHAVGGERCAPGCIDAEIEREREEAIARGDYDRSDDDESEG